MKNISISKSKNNLAFVALAQKYSDFNIMNYFYNHSKFPNQISSLYYNDPVAKKIILNDIINRHILLRDALYYPSFNIQTIENHQLYFWDPKNYLNAELRGPQAHLSRQMYFDFGKAGNGIEKTNLSGIHLGSLFGVKNSCNIVCPTDMVNASPYSFGQALEISGARMYSSKFGQTVSLTNDDPNNLLFASTMHNSMPPTNTISDYQVFDPKIPNVINNVENKIITVNKASSNQIIGMAQASFCGAIDPKLHIATVQDVAHNALIMMQKNDKIIEHIDPSKNTPCNVSSELRNLFKTGRTYDGKNLVKLHHIFSNEDNT